LPALREVNEEKSAACNAGLLPALAATGEGKDKEAAPAGKSVVHAKTVAADQLTLWVRRNATARKKTLARSVPSVVATVAA
jgi:hypothetical protein